MTERYDELPLAAAVDRALTEHSSWGYLRDGSRRWICSCGADIDSNPSGINILARHRTHVRNALLEVIEPYVIPPAATTEQEANRG